MSLETWIVYVSAVFFFLLSPSISHLYMLSTSLNYGFKKSVATGLGDLSAHVWQTTIVAAGLASIVYTSKNTFIFIKWIGVFFLLYLAIKQFNKNNFFTDKKDKENISIIRLYLNGLFMSSSNPKAIIFFAALFPLFIDYSQPTGIQFFIFGLTYVVMDGAFLLFYGYFASWSKEKFGKYINIYLNKISGGLLFLSAILLALNDINN